MDPIWDPLLEGSWQVPLHVDAEKHYVLTCAQMGPVREGVIKWGDFGSKRVKNGSRMGKMTTFWSFWGIIDLGMLKTYNHSPRIFTVISRDFVFWAFIGGTPWNTPILGWGPKMGPFLRPVMANATIMKKGQILDKPRTNGVRRGSSFGPLLVKKWWKRVKKMTLFWRFRLRILEAFAKMGVQKVTPRFGGHDFGGPGSRS